MAQEGSAVQETKIYVCMSVLCTIYVLEYDIPVFYSVYSVGSHWIPYLNLSLSSKQCVGSHWSPYLSLSMQQTPRIRINRTMRQHSKSAVGMSSCGKQQLWETALSHQCNPMHTT